MQSKCSQWFLISWSLQRECPYAEATLYKIDSNACWQRAEKHVPWLTYAGGAVASGMEVDAEPSASLPAAFTDVTAEAGLGLDAAAAADRKADGPPAVQLMQPVQHHCWQLLQNMHREPAQK